MRVVIMTLVLAASAAHAAEIDPELLSSPERALVEAQKLLDDGQTSTAEELLEEAHKRYRGNMAITKRLADLLYTTERYGAAEIIYRELLEEREDPTARQRITEIESLYEKWSSRLRIAVIQMGKMIDAGNYDTAIAIGDRAIGRFPDSDVLYTYRGQALLFKGQLERAEESLRRALQINPQNTQARALVEDIRITEQAQISTEVAEWISIAKDKVGDFIVTFLALFAAFIANATISPLILRIKLNIARRAFEKGNYDDFTDLIEGLLDEENFAPLRTNLRFMLRERSYDEAREILNKYVNTLDRLPTLLRILEREHERMLEAD